MWSTRHVENMFEPRDADDDTPDEKDSGECPACPTYTFTGRPWTTRFAWDARRSCLFVNVHLEDEMESEETAGPIWDF